MINDNYKIRVINNKVLLINIYTSSEIMVFDGVAKEIICGLKNNKSVTKLIDKISISYNQDKETIKKDVYSFINELKQLGIYNE